MDIKNKEEFIQILKNTKAKIATKTVWCQWALAVDCSNNAVHELDSRACKWCLMGALDCTRTEFGLQRANICAPLIELGKQLFPALNDSSKNHMTLQDINDELGFDAVHEFLDYCITELQNQIEEENDKIKPSANPSSNQIVGGS